MLNRLKKLISYRWNYLKGCVHVLLRLAKINKISCEFQYANVKNAVFAEKVLTIRRKSGIIFDVDGTSDAGVVQW